MYAEDAEMEWHSAGRPTAREALIAEGMTEEEVDEELAKDIEED